MKILWHSNAPWCPTGYGSQTELFAPLIRDAGHDVAISAFYGLNGAKQVWDGMTVYPGSITFGGDKIPLYAFDHGDGDPASVQVITLMDVWALTHDILKQMTIASWVPVDHDPVPLRVRHYFDVTGATPIAMSRHGQNRLNDEGLDALYVPHGIDTERLKPLETYKAREALGIPADAFLVGMVAANSGHQPPRKGFPEAFKAFAEFRRHHEDALLYVHSLHTADPDGRNGVNLRALANLMGIPDEALAFTDQMAMGLGIPYEAMATIYSAFDVLLSPSYGEGFGIPIVEAQACGVPVIVNDWTAMSELAGPGWKVGGYPFFNVPNAAYWQIPFVPELIDALEEAYTDAGNRREAAREFALAYDIHTVMTDHWLPVLEQLQKPREVAPLPLPNRKLRRAAERQGRAA